MSTPPDHTLASLAVGPLLLRADGSVLIVEDGPTAVALAPGVLAILAGRYGRPPAPEVPPPARWLLLDGGARVATLSYRSPVDVIANDYGLLDAGDGSGPRMVPAPLMVAALRALMRSAGSTG